MNRRMFLTTLATAAATSLMVAQSALPIAQAAGAGPTVPKGKRPLNIAQFNAAIANISAARVAKLDSDLTYATIPQIQALFQQGQLTSEELTTYYLWRIKRYDVDKLNSVTELNPDAIEIAKQLDAERAAGKVRGPLHGTAVLLIDVLGTGDKMHNTAGAKALLNAKSDRDAFVVKRLRDAGVVVLGKTALMEWTGFMNFQPTSGYSALGGQVYNPYNKTSDPSGSSTGSAVAVAANFATFSLGEESFGALILPAVSNSTATFKPSMGLVSRDRLIPNIDAEDTVGPMTRNVTDMALVMDVLAATDKNDPVTVAASSAEKGFAEKLNVNALRGKRIGMLPAYTPDDEKINSRMIEALKQAGAQIVPLAKEPELVPGEFEELDPINAYGLKFGVERYLAWTNAPVKTIQEIVDFNNQDLKDRAKDGQEYLVMSAKSTMSSDEYSKRALAMGEKARAHIDSLLSSNQLDFIAGTDVAVPITIYYAGAGYPAVAIPAGYRANGAPVGFVLTGRLFDDSKLIRAAYALEQATRTWHAPDLRNWR